MTVTSTPVVIRQDRRLIRAAGQSVRYVLIDIAAPRADRKRPRQAVNLSFVLDRSGSMSGRKLALAKTAVEHALSRLHEDDRFSIVTYDDQVDLVVESTFASAEAQRNARERLGQIDARGSTDLAAGWLRGCEQVARHQADATVDRCLLLTDGLANRGITDPAEIARHAAELRARGISTTTFGVGTDFDEALLQAVATAAGGNFYYVENAVQIPDLITSEVGETLEVVARDTTIAIAAPGIDVQPLGPFPHERAGDAALVQIGELVSEQELQVVLKLTFPRGRINGEHRPVVRLLDREGVFAGASHELEFRYASRRANDDEPRDRLVDRKVAGLYAARARQEAVALNRAGQFDQARAVLHRVAERIRTYAGHDPELLAIADELETETLVFAMAMAPQALKEVHFRSANVMRCRDEVGHARKRPTMPQ